MSDEDKLSKATAKAVRAEALLGNELLAEAFKALEDAYVRAWRATAINEAPARENLFLAINIVGKVKEHLQAVVSGGTLAAAELREIAAAAEHERLFGRRHIGG